MKLTITGTVAFGVVVFGFLLASAEAVQTIDASGNYLFDLSSDDGYSGNITGTDITVTKRGAGTLTLTGSHTFTGTVVVEGGTLLDKASEMTATKAVVKEGATLNVAARGTMWGYIYKDVTISGSGVDGTGAYVRSGGTACRGQWCSLKLDADATVNFAQNHNPGTVYLNGHTLTLKGHWDALASTPLANVNSGEAHGNLVLDAGSTLQMQNGYLTDVGDSRNTLTLNGATIKQVGGTGSIPWTVCVNADSAAEAYTFTGPVRCENGSVLSIASGTVTFDNSLDVGMGKVLVDSTAAAGTKAVFNGDVTQTNTAVSALSVWGGDMTFKGGEKVRLDGGITGKWAEKAKGRISFENVGRVDVGEAFLAGAEATPQVLCVSNSTFCQTGKLDLGSNYSYAFVETYDSAFTNTATVSVGTHAGDQWDSKLGNRGAFLQHGGDVCLNGLQVGHSSKRGNTGYYGKTGGRLTVTGELDMDTYGFGALYFDGGTADFTLSSGNHVACASGGSCVWYQYGGAVNTLRNLRIGYNGSGYESLVNTSTLIALEGAGTRLGCASNEMGAINLYAKGDVDNTVNIVVNDGAELALSGLQRRSSVKGSQLSWTISVDGGVLHPASTEKTAWGTQDYLPDRVIVGECGFELKTETEFTWQTPFVAPTGKVVSAISLPTDAGFLASQGKYMGPADVRISGSGVGATAVSLYDPATRSITGVRILSTGTGYDDDTTVTIASQAGAATATYVCPVTMADAPMSGKGFLKSGEGMYILGINNTYKGDTAVSDGYLLVSGPTALPAGSGITVYGGEVGFYQFTPTVPYLKGLGTGLVRNALTVTDTLTLTNSPTAKLTVDGKLTLADGAALELVGPITDIGEQKCVLLEATGGIEQLGAFTLPQLTDHYYVLVSGNKITVGLQRGTVMILR